MNVKVASTCTKMDPCGTNFQASAIKLATASSSLSSAWKGRYNTLQKKTRLLVKGRKINLPQQLQPELSRGDRNVKSHAEMIQHQLFLNRHNCSQILHCKGWSSHTFAFQCSCKKLHTVHT